MWCVAQISEQGPGGGEDVVQTLPLDAGHALVVVDGAGGQSGGRRAAWLTTNTLITKLDDDPLILASGLAWWMGDIDNTLYRDKRAGEAAALALIVDDAGLKGGLAGDVAAWARVDGACRRLDDAGEKVWRLGSKRVIPGQIEVPGAVEAALVMSDGLWKPLVSARAASGEPLIDAVLGEVAAGALAPSAALSTLMEAARAQGGGLSDDASGAIIVKR